MIAENSTLVDLVFGNSLLLGKIADHLKQPDLAKLCQTHKLVWHTIFPRLWKCPQLHTTRQIEAFSRSVGNLLPCAMDALQYYGGLVQVLDFSDTYMWRGSLAYGLLSPIFKHCTHVRVLNLKQCTTLCGNNFRGLFLASPQLCLSLTSLNIAGMCTIVSQVKVVFQRLPNIKKLVLNRTNINNAVLLIVSQYMPSLEHLEIVNCGQVTDLAIQALAKGCPKLSYLQTRRCKHIHDTNLLQQIGARGGPVHTCDDPGSDEEYSYYFDYMDRERYDSDYTNDSDRDFGFAYGYDYDYD
ncbi:F-box and leucine-rich repeat protein 4 [Coemansia sp. RSA 2337]|nr:F-box and leucine-rich repeat protein 4 [Coemansia sp. S680]KAJ2031196.1 F-box and leucine-rich repeat protein 4 [Coemansia sp. S3946]KAJ2070571.1 F-box and leucine-rich repeat protein 4 [Coemansia sp. S155-1]KAJ2106301.1 F-box and leucine-rich repeat protein 4 [Coemansia sp. RSA 922]KAJ2466978.1 F-box and leucine-rich repeat protein 4 [Coemansia sp. RSA 2337]